MTTPASNRPLLLSLLAAAIGVASCCPDLQTTQGNCEAVPIPGTPNMTVTCTTTVVQGSDSTQVVATDTIPDPAQ